MSILPKTHTQKLFITARHVAYPEPHYELSLDSFDMTSGDNLMGYILIGCTEVTVDIPECNPVQAEIEAIEKARNKILADAQAKATLLNQRIQNLLFIAHEDTA